jgi:hypothetical protein
MLTVKLAGDSKSMIMAGDELTVADSGDELQKGTAKFVMPLAPLGAWILLDDHWDTAELLDHFTAQGLAGNGGSLKNSGDVYGWCCKCLGETGRDGGPEGEWRGTRVSGPSPQRFYWTREWSTVSSLWRLLLGDEARKELWRIVDVGAVSPCVW